jgi:predicted site-specific integrase-resolvase
MTAASPFVNIEDVSKHFVVSVATVRKWIKTGVIPKRTYLKIGNTYRFNLPDVVDALTTAPAGTQLELDLGDQA